jgi:CheY-like chemotaxis protein
MVAKEKRRKNLKQGVKNASGGDALETLRDASDPLKVKGACRAAGKKWVLVMENDKILRMVARRILEKAGYGVYLTDNGDDAIEGYRIAKHCGYQFTAVILDQNTPYGKGGVETIRKLREIDPEVRAFISTGNVSAHEIKNYREHGFRSVLAKPFKPKELKQALLDVL